MSSAAATKASTTAAPVTSRRLRVAPGPAADTAGGALDTDALLELLERGPLTAGELRILLELLDGERAVSELASTFGQLPVQVRRTGARLLGRGLLRWRQTGSGKEDAVFGITLTGLATLGPLLADAGVRVRAA